MLYALSNYILTWDSEIHIYGLFFFLGTSQSAQVSEIAAPSSNIGSRGVVSVSSQLPVAYPIRSGGVASVSSHHPVAYSAPPTDTRVAAPAVLHSVSGMVMTKKINFFILN
jgi:hypothetical protein